MTASASAAWTATGGTLSAANGPSVTWTAPAAAATPAITATPASGAPCTVSMTVIPPSRAQLTRRVNWVYTPTLSGSGYETKLELLPLSVCFSRVQWREEVATSVANGYYDTVLHWNNIQHPQTASWIPVDASNSGIKDDVGTRVPGEGGPFSAGSFTWPIPQSYLVVGGSGNGFVFSTNTHVQVMSGPTGQETTTKDAATRTRTPTAPPAPAPTGPVPSPGDSGRSASGPTSELARPTSNGPPPPAQAPPIQAPPVQAPPVQAPPVQALPVQAPPVQAPPVQAPPAQAPPVPCTITTATVAAAPSGAPNTRTTVGVNEQVTMTASAAAAWTVTGGTLSAANGTVVTWTAPAAPATSSVTATPAVGAPCSVAMTTIAPSAAVLTKNGDIAYTAALSGSGFTAALSVAPLSVCFSRIQIREEAVNAVATGYYDTVIHANGVPHQQTPSWINIGANNGGPTDTVGTVAPGLAGPFMVGTFTWPIPQSYRATGSGSGTVYSTGTHTQVMAGQNGAETTSKEGASRSRTPTP